MDQFKAAPDQHVVGQQMINFAAEIRTTIDEETKKLEQQRADIDRRQWERQVDRDRRQDEERRLSNEERQMRRAEMVAKSIVHCDGSNQDAIREWIREVDGSQDDTTYTLVVAKLASRGPLKRAVAHYVTTNKDNSTWAKCREHIHRIFLSPREIDRLRAELKNIEQGGFETTAAYSLRFRELAESAYPPTFTNTGVPIERPALIEDMIVDAFVGGLTDQDMGDKLLNFGQPKNYIEAIDKIAEYDANKVKLHLSRKRQTIRVEEPMDISAISKPPPQPKDELAEVKRQVSGLTAQFTKLMAVLESQPQRSPQPNTDNGSQRQPTQHDYTPDGRPICTYCGKVGHVQRVCRKRQYVYNTENTRRPNSNGRGKPRSFQGGH